MHSLTYPGTHKIIVNNIIIIIIWALFPSKWGRQSFATSWPDVHPPVVSANFTAKETMNLIGACHILKGQILLDLKKHLEKRKNMRKLL